MTENLYSHPYGIIMRQISEKLILSDKTYNEFSVPIIIVFTIFNLIFTCYKQ